jgi:hypothetical protein
VIAVRAADLEQFESELFDPGQHAVQRGLVRDPPQQRVVASGLGVQGGERRNVVEPRWPRTRIW